MKDLYTVQEFSELTGVTASKLRYWADIGIFSPIKRDSDNNYRYYSIAQIPTLNFLSVLSDLEIPLKVIAELRKERDPENLLRLLDKKERQIDMELLLLRMRSSIIHARQELIRYGLKIDENEISVLDREDKAMVLWERNEYQEDDTFINPLASFITKAGEYHINLDFPIGGYWDDMESYIKDPARPQNFLSIDPIGTHIRKAGKYLVGFARGYYAEMGDLPERMAEYARKNNLIISGPVYVIYLHDEICMREPSQYLAQACVAVSKHRQKAKK